MKFTVFLSILFLTAVSYGEVKRPGTFVPSLCSEEPSGQPSADIVAVKAVCVGKIAGFNQEAIKLTLSDNTSRQFKISYDGKLGRMGLSTQTFTGAAIEVKDNIWGKISSTSGITVTYGIVLKTDSNLKFKGPLHTVFVTQ